MMGRQDGDQGTGAAFQSTNTHRGVNFMLLLTMDL